MSIHKKEFLEDYIFKEEEREKHKSELLNRLLDRNRAIKSQISGFYKKRPKKTPAVINMPPPCLSKSSGD